MEAEGVEATPKVYKREPGKRVFVNRSLMLEKIKFFGFDMDYTLAVYKSPDYEALGFNLLKERLVHIGYPEDIHDFEYDPTFPIRGLWFDTMYGTLLKVDAFGNILVCVYGFRYLNGHEIHSMYPNRFVGHDEQRFRIFNTLYDLPVIYILVCLVDYFSNKSEYTRTRMGVKIGDITMTFKSMYQDVMVATEFVHNSEGPLKQETVNNVERYVSKDKNLPVLLDRLRNHGATVFLATNSGYQYTDKIMSYLFDFSDSQPAQPARDWQSYFHFIVVDARKPLFFGEGTLLRQVDKSTGGLKIGTHTGPIKQEQIYSGGSVDVFSDIMGVYGSEVLYVGDHIFGDILKSKKVRGWRTFLIVPELAHELGVWTNRRALFARLEQLDRKIANLYKDLDSSTDVKPDISNIRNEMREVTHQMDMSYGLLGSVFRCGSQQTHFASQVARYADVYAESFLNLMYYPLCYIFRAPPMLMAHESTVDHQENLYMDVSQRRLVMASRSRTVEEDVLEEEAWQRQPLSRTDSVVPNLYAATPTQITHVLDDEVFGGSDTGPLTPRAPKPSEDE